MAYPVDFVKVSTVGLESSPRIVLVIKGEY